MGFGAVGRGCFVQRAGFRRRNGNGPAITPESQRYAASAVVVHHFGDGVGQGLHGLLG